MKFWRRWPGDYAAKTADLTMLEHGAYSMLLDHYYSTEHGLPKEIDRLAIICGAVNGIDRQAVETIAERFFPVGEDGIRHNKRADEEIEKHRAYTEAQSERGRLGMERRWKKTQEAPQPRKQRSNGELHLHAEFDAFWQLYPRKVSKGHALKAWGKVPEGAYAAVLDALKAQIGQWDDPKFIPHPATWLNGRRWEDDVQAVAPKRELGACEYCPQPAVKLTNDIPHCARLDHLDMAIARRR